MPRIKIKDISDAMDIISDEMPSFLNKDSGAIVSIHQDVLTAVYDGDDEGAKEEAEMLGGTEGDIKTAKEIAAEESRWVLLPAKEEINDWEIMRDFCESMENESVRGALFSAIQGSGAFRRFRDTCTRLGVLDKWYEFKDRQYLAFAKQWCEDNSVEWEE
jgi:hypothetical protein